MHLQRCPGCGADLGPRRHCLTCDIELVDERARVRGTLARAGERELAISLRSGEILRAHLSPDVLRLGVKEPREGLELEALGAPERVFDEPCGGLRDVPEQHERFVVQTFALGPHAGEILQRTLDGPTTEPPEGDEELEEIPWPEGLGVDPRPGRSGRWRLRLRLAPKPFPWLALSPLLPLLFIGAYVAFLSPRSRPLIGAGALALVLLFLLIRALRGRLLLLDADYLRRQRGVLPIFRSRFLPSKEIAGVIATRDGSGHAVEVITTAGPREPLLWGLPDRTRTVLVARLLETALGVGPSSDPGEELRGKLPDLEALLRPPREVAEEEERGREKLVQFKDPFADNVSATRRGQRLELTTPEASVSIRLIYVVVPAVLWLGVTYNRGFSVPSLPGFVDLLAWALAALGGYAILAAFVNRTTFVVTPRLFRMRRGPLPWPDALRCPLAQIARLDTDSDMVGRGGSIYFLHAFLYDGRRVCLLRDAGGSGRVNFLKKTLWEEIRRARAARR